MPATRKTIKVLVVDDSLFMRTLIANILEKYEDIIVVGTGKDGYEAIEKINLLHPDVITLDIDMPRLDGLTTLGYIMSECPTAVIIISGVLGKSSEATMKALDYGAVDFIAKPAGPISLNIRTIEGELINKVRTAVNVDLKKLPLVMFRQEPKIEVPKEIPEPYLSGFPLVIIGASTGGPRAVSYLMQSLSGSCLTASYLIIQHMPSGFTSHFAKRIDKLSVMKITEACEGDVLAPGIAYVAPAGRHLLVEKQEEDIAIKFDDGPKELGLKPALNVTLRSVAKLKYSKILSVILTGMGNDGADGCKILKKAGGTIIVQDERSSVVFGMPKAAVKTGCVDEVLSLEEIPDRVIDLIK